ncbi:MAG: hypothetical protein QM534_10625 [Sediminibacterium sp.]|nr:hypothetical protein [Sediminibacterium sp.]
MRNVAIKWSLLILVLVFQACDKEKINTQRMSGAYSVTEYKQFWFSKGNQDSSKTTGNAGWWGLYDSDSDDFNNVSPSSTFKPASWKVFMSKPGGTNGLWWETDRMSIKTLTIHKYVDAGNSPFVRYTVTKKRLRQMELQYIESRNDTIVYKEIIVLKRQ